LNRVHFLLRVSPSVAVWRAWRVSWFANLLSLGAVAEVVLSGSHTSLRWLDANERRE